MSRTIKGTDKAAVKSQRKEDKGKRSIRKEISRANGR